MRCFLCSDCQHVWDTTETAREEHAGLKHRRTEFREEHEALKTNHSTESSTPNIKPGFGSTWGAEEPTAQ
jgi:hypothetical protein